MAAAVAAAAVAVAAALRTQQRLLMNFFVFQSPLAALTETFKSFFIYGRLAVCEQLKWKQ